MSASFLIDVVKSDTCCSMAGSVSLNFSTRLCQLLPLPFLLNSFPVLFGGRLELL